VLEAYARLGLANAASVIERKNLLKKYFQNIVKTDSAGRKFFYSIVCFLFSFVL
jgi:hypothetical protein